MAKSGSSRRRVADYDWSTRSKSSITGTKRPSSKKNKKPATDEEIGNQHIDQKQQISTPAAESSGIEERQVDAYDNPTVVFQCINYGDWDGAADRVVSHPEEAATWIVRHIITTKSTSTERGRTGKNDDGQNIKWRYLPLHLACLQRNPSLRLVKKLLAAFPDATSRRDHDGNLPIHLVCNSSGGKNQEIVQLLVDANPKGCCKKNSKRRTPAEILRRKVKDGTFSGSDTKAAMAILQAEGAVGEEKMKKSKEKQQRHDRNEEDARDDDKSNDSSDRRSAAVHSRNSSKDSLSWYMSDEDAIANTAPATFSLSSNSYHSNSSPTSRSNNSADNEITLRWKSMEKTMQKNIQLLETSLDKMTAERDMFREELSRMEQHGKEEVMDKDVQIDDLIRMVAELEDRAIDADDLRHQAKEHIDQIDAMAEENFAFKHEIDGLAAELDEAHHRLALQQQDFEERLEAAREEMAMHYTHQNHQEDENDAVPSHKVDELQAEMEEIRADRDALADMLASERDSVDRGHTDLQIRCKHLEEQLDVYHENDIRLKQELHDMAKERDELLDEVDAIKSKAKQDAINAKAAFDARQKALRDEIQSIWNVVKAISQSSPSKKGELMERILELGENQEETTDESGVTDAEEDAGEDIDVDQTAANDGNDTDDVGRSMTKTNSFIGVDQDNKSMSKPAGVSAMSSRQASVAGIDQDTISAISESTSMWDEELDLDGIDGTDVEELDDADGAVERPVGATNSISANATEVVDNDGSVLSSDQWLAEIDDEVRALEEECEALGLQFEGEEGET